MAEKENVVFEELVDEATKQFALGHDDTYISNQFAEQGIDGDTIDKVLLQINGIRKAIDRQDGVKRIVYGLSFIVVGIVATYIASHWEAPVGYVLWALPVFGVVSTVKGISKIVG